MPPMRPKARGRRFRGTKEATLAGHLEWWVEGGCAYWTETGLRWNRKRDQRFRSDAVSVEVWTVMSGGRGEAGRLTPATARPTIKAVDVGATAVTRLPTSKMNTAAR
jgi:hypothetical protein